MLFEKTLSEGDIGVFKLVNGDEIVAKITGTLANGWKINRPCSVLPSQQGIGLVQTLISADLNKDVELDRQHVILASTAVKQIEDHYFTTTTGIQTVGKGPIIT